MNIKHNGVQKKITLVANQKLLWITIFAIAMGLVESSVVIYLRELYYPGGFKFPLHIISNIVAITELLRELATLIMLAAIGMLAGKNNNERFAWFIYSFAIWDISYYLFLYFIIGWPLSLSDCDILFLIPLLWVGPVWAPLVLSVLMILLAFSIVYFSSQGQTAILKMREWIIFTAGALMVITAFCKDYYLFVTSHNPNLPTTQLFFSKEAIGYAVKYYPAEFDLRLFLLGCIVIFMGIAIYGVRNWKSLNS